MKQLKQQGESAVLYLGSLFVIGVVLIAAYLILQPLLNNIFQAATYPSNHALVNHSDVAWEAIQACNSSNTTNKVVMHNPATGRQMTACELNGHFYIVLDEANGHNVTAYEKKWYSQWEQILNLLKNGGFTP